MTEQDDDEAPGWDAIDGAMERLYPGQEEPPHMGTTFDQRIAFGGPEVIDGFSAYRAGGPPPHWHWVTYGLTELYAKENDDPEWSGHGFELTMRVPVLDGEEPDRPDDWAVTILQTLANHAHEVGRPYEHGVRLTVDGVVGRGGTPTALVGFGFHEDPDLPAIDTPHGRVQFLHVLGLTQDEYDLWVEHGPERVLALAGSPVAFNDPARKSLAGSAA